MRLRVLGCSGGIGGRHLRTTSFLVDHDILIDAGSGVGDLSLAELTQIDHIFVTHSHLDHVTSIPFLVDTVGGMRDRPLTVHAIAPTIEILKNHLFNWAIWPDFTEIPTAEAPFMRYEEVELACSVTIGGRKFTPLPAVHTVPAVGYHLESGAGSLVNLVEDTVLALGGDEFGLGTAGRRWLDEDELLVRRRVHRDMRRQLDANKL